MISLTAYWMGRDIQFADQLTDEIRTNAEVTVGRANALLERAGMENRTGVNSGWRPLAVNDSTSNAAKNSTHIKGKAVDIPDPDRALARWCCDNRAVLEDIGLWMEDPRWTFSAHGNHWVHVQTVPPRSGNRIYVPSSADAGDPGFNIEPQT